MLNQTDLSRIDLNLLVLFETVMDTGHVGRAAERMHLSPSAVSHGLRRLRLLLADPVFIRTPRGVTPTDRAELLAPLIADVLSGVREVLGNAEPFTPEHSTRRFRIGAPDGVLASLLPGLLRQFARDAPGIALNLHQLLPRRGPPDLATAWEGTLAHLESRALDVAIIPTGEVPRRFSGFPLMEEDFVVAMRSDHPFAAQPDLMNYCRQSHIVVSASGDHFGNIDAALAEQGLSRHVAMTVPNMMLAIALLASGDFVCALPRRLAAQYGQLLGINTSELPLTLPTYMLTAVVPTAALQDRGLAWLLATIETAAASGMDGTQSDR